MNNKWGWLAVVCVVVIGVYAYMAQSSVWEMWSQDGADSNYNLLVQGFQARQLSLKKKVPPGFARLADPYDPAANRLYRGVPYRMHDLSYYKGRLYMYFGVTPALILFWPYVAATGQYLFHRQAVMVFCAVGFLASVSLLHALWRRYFPEVSVAVVAACALALGLATGVPEQLSQADFYEVADTCGYMLIMLALCAIWHALHEPEQKKCWWLATASAAYGLAVGARPSLLFGAAILLVPVVQGWGERRQRVWALLAVTGPILLIGFGLMLYNALRFDNPFEFGLRFQLNLDRQGSHQFFSLHYLWLNFRVYFLEPARWSVSFPFVHEIAITRVPPGHAPTGRAYGVLTNVPLVWLALAVPLAWRSQSGPGAWILHWFISAVAFLFGVCALTIGLLWSASFRYEVDFLPTLVLLAVIGILGLERALASRPVRRRVVRWSWGLLLGFSAAFNLLATVEHYAEAHESRGEGLWQAGKVTEAMREYKYVLQLNPDYADAHVNLGVILAESGRSDEAVRHYKEALRVNPRAATAYMNLGNALLAQHKPDEAIYQYEEALRVKPDYTEAHMNLGNTLLTQGKLPDAMSHYKEALRINPDYAQAHDNFGIALAQAGRIPEAMEHWGQALRINPGDFQAHCNLGNALEGQGRVPEAIEQYEQALSLRPDFIAASNALARLRAVPTGR